MGCSLHLIQAANSNPEMLQIWLNLATIIKKAFIFQQLGLPGTWLTALREMNLDKTCFSTSTRSCSWCQRIFSLFFSPLFVQDILGRTKDTDECSAIYQMMEDKISEKN